MVAWETKARRRVNIRDRAGTVNEYGGQCRVPGCPRWTSSAAGEGVGKRYCRKHQNAFQRHGHPTKGSYSLATLGPCRRAAYDWLRLNDRDQDARLAIEDVAVLMASYMHEEAFRLRGLKPRERAGIAWARLRREGVPPVLPVAAWIGVEIAMQEDPAPILTPDFREYRRVQAAKVVHRLASGTHKEWGDPSLFPGSPEARTRRLDVFPRSSGLVLRYIGSDLEKAVGSLARDRLGEILRFKIEREAAGKLSARPHPALEAVRRWDPTRRPGEDWVEPEDDAEWQGVGG